ncbi:hypothetical protein J2T06_001997 [Enterobacter ludwigii]|jgi:hypothetical protein|nr:hypothetical protein [Enterobacter ludwigii]
MGFDANGMQVYLLLHGGSQPSGAGLYLFYRNQCLKDHDNWRQ